ncbi:MAG: hypothetical protein M4D80_20305 [Myxococcota bacterium]|nr:hypothetical protein [Deltaproteobacteria bacterium]MDQ3337512.1 hypothetical protein [Myxococcota bacterium]
MRAALLVLLLAACSRDKAADAPIAQPTLDKPAAAEKKAPPKPAKLQQVTLKALGMYCEESCPIKVRYALADNPNVYELGFDVSNEAIFVSYDASLGTPKEVTKPMLAAIKTKAGFDPWLSKDSWPDDAQGKVQVVWR